MKKQLENLANAMLLQEGLASDGWVFRWNNNKTSFGLCNYSNKTVELSAWLYDNTDAHEKFIDTVKHEVAHALTPRCGHNRVWKAMARRLGAIPKASEYVPKNDPLKDAKHVVVNTYNNGKEVVKSYFRKPPATAYNKISTQWLRGKPQTKGSLVIMSIAEYRRNYE